MGNVSKPTSDLFETPKISVSFMVRTYYIRWIMALVVVLFLYLTIQSLIMSALDSSFSFTSFTDGGVISPSVTAYLLIVIGSVIACGINIWAAVMAMLLILYASFHHGYGTLAHSLIPTGFFPIMLTMIAVLAGVQLLRNYTAYKDQDGLSPLPTVPVVAINVAVIIVVLILNSYGVYSFFITQ